MVEPETEREQEPQSQEQDQEMQSLLSRTRTNCGDRALSEAGPRVWNYLPTELRQPVIQTVTEDVVFLPRRANPHLLCFRNRFIYQHRGLAYMHAYIHAYSFSYLLTLTGQVSDVFQRCHVLFSAIQRYTMTYRYDHLFPFCLMQQPSDWLYKYFF